jgi:dipeptidyl aminopeptidase/acylaminoacyl peptidase
MPWFGCELMVADLDPGGGLSRPRRIAGNENESIFQPGWRGNGTLTYCSDLQGRWTLWEHRPNGPIPLPSPAGECGLPLWQFGMQTWSEISPDQLAVASCDQGHWGIWLLDLTTEKLSPVATDLQSLQHLHATEGCALALGGSHQATQILLQIESSGETTAISGLPGLVLPEALTSMARALAFPTTEGEKCHAWYYPPKNPAYRSLPGEKPPLILLCHGGPTSATTPALSLKVQFWTSRGFAVVDVNYRGSTGYGRAYRCALDGFWGIRDAQDACAAALGEHIHADYHDHEHLRQLADQVDLVTFEFESVPADTVAFLSQFFQTVLNQLKDFPY